MYFTKLRSQKYDTLLETEIILEQHYYCNPCWAEDRGSFEELQDHTTLNKVHSFYEYLSPEILKANDKMNFLKLIENDNPLLTVARDRVIQLLHEEGQEAYIFKITTTTVMDPDKLGVHITGRFETCEEYNVHSMEYLFDDYDLLTKNEQPARYSGYDLHDVSNDFALED